MHAALAVAFAAGLLDFGLYCAVLCGMGATPWLPARQKVALIASLLWLALLAHRLRERAR